MNDIGGNLIGIIQTCTTERNAIGETVRKWTDVQPIRGWLDLSGGSSNYSAYSAKIQDSSHVFISDYVELANGIQAENSRMTINGKTYDIMLIDNPMELCHHLEIYLKYTGGQ